MLEFSVEDTGIGIAEESQGRLFEKFSQIDDSSTRQYGGSGLGLSIVRKLARMMDGEAGVESKAGQGSRFWFRVRVPRVPATEPAGKAPARPLVDDPPTAPPLSGHVLVADDVATNRAVLGAMLPKLGLTVRMVEDGHQAVEAVRSGENFDCVLMDVLMPGVDGLEASRRIRSWEAAQGRPRCPIVAVTANAYAEDREACTAAGMDGFVEKPITLRGLRETLAAHLSR